MNSSKVKANQINTLLNKLDKDSLKRILTIIFQHLTENEIRGVIELSLIHI